MNLFQCIASFLQKAEDRTGNFSMNRQKWTDKEVVDFIIQLKQVIKWTNKLSKDFDYENGFYGTVFRQTNPIIKGVKLYSFDGDYTTWNLNDYDHNLYERLLDLAINVRDKIDEFDLTRLNDLGRILCFQTCVTTHDGAPLVESNCFVDEGDVPPIDTWFYLKSNYYHSEFLCDQSLFCWIPKRFEKVMDQAINVEFLDSYTWLDVNDLDMYNLIIKGS